MKRSDTVLQSEFLLEFKRFMSKDVLRRLTGKLATATKKEKAASV